jgi:hypothetical protein
VVGYRRGHSLISIIHGNVICLGGVYLVACPHAVLRCEHSRKRQLFVDMDIRLFEAVKDENEAQRLIEHGAHVNYADINGGARLLDASYRDDLRVAVTVAGCRRVADDSAPVPVLRFPFLSSMTFLGSRQSTFTPLRS